MIDATKGHTNRAMTNPLTNRKIVGMLAGLLLASTFSSAVALFFVILHRYPGWQSVAAELLLVFVLALEGIIAYGAFFREEIVSAEQRRQLTIGLLEKFISPEFWAARAETWRIRYEWSQGDRSLVKFFVRTDERVNVPNEEPKCANGLTPHQNLSWLLNFYVCVQSYHEAGLLDGSLAATLLGSHYEWNRKFFHEFCEEYRRQASATGVEFKPAWLEALPKLENTFKSSKTLPRNDEK